MNRLFKSLFSIHIDPKRVFGLDILRCIAILAVVWGHAVYKSEHREILELIIPIDGVSLFFVLSGYLIGGILIKVVNENDANLPVLWNFWTRRWLRTIPNYLLILTALLTLSTFLIPDFRPVEYIRFFIFSQNFATAHPNFFHEAWSLAVEEWFYLLTPLSLFLLIGISRGKIRLSILTVAIGMIMAATAFRLQRYLIHPPTEVYQWNSFFRMQVATRLDAIMYGVLGAYVAYYHKGFWTRFKKPMLLIGIPLTVIPFLLPLSYSSLYACVFSFSVFSIGILLCLPFMSQVKSGKGILYRAVTHISLISYSMYLTNHTLIRELIINEMLYSHLQVFGTAADAVCFVLLWILTLGLSTILYKFVEIPFMGLRDSKGGKPALSLVKSILHSKSKK